MDRSEELVKRYLESLGCPGVVHEPDGNVPPDFLIDGRIAVEVRRLNQLVVGEDGKARGLEEMFRPFWDRMRSYLPTIAPSLDGESWFVCIDVSRPLERWKTVESKLRKVLLAFMANPDRMPQRTLITDHLCIEFLRASKNRHSTFFLLGGGSDSDAGGWVLSDVHRNLQICSEEKERKVAPYRHRYPEWWLVLPDHVGYRLDAEDRRQIRDLPLISHSWDRLILINPIDGESAFVIWPVE